MFYYSPQQICVHCCLSPSIFVSMAAPIWPFYACNNHMAFLLLVSRLLKGDGFVWCSSFAPDNESVHTRCSWILSSCLVINKFQIWHVIFREQDMLFVDQNDMNIHVALMHKRQIHLVKLSRGGENSVQYCCFHHFAVTRTATRLIRVWIYDIYICIRSAVFSTW